MEQSPLEPKRTNHERSSYQFDSCPLLWTDRGKRFLELAKASSTLADVELTRMALERRVGRLRAFQAARELWITEIAILPNESDIQVWDVQRRLEGAEPSLGDYFGIVLGDLEDRGMVNVTIDGKLQRTELTPQPALRQTSS